MAGEALMAGGVMVTPFGLTGCNKIYPTLKAASMGLHTVKVYFTSLFSQ